jgi:molybdopterin molybdotransferase
MTKFEMRAPDWLSVKDALERVLLSAVPLGEEVVPAHDALGRALARGVLARAHLPPWDNSAMDGYAARAQDLRGASRGAPVTLQVVGETRAGEVAGRAIGQGEAVRIMTGAPIPPGADSVIRVEDTDAEATPGRVRVFSDSDAERHIRPGGQDMREGEEVLRAGTSIGTGQMGLLAASGAGSVAVHRRPRAAILSNGDELVQAENFHRVTTGKGIPETNTATLGAGVILAGGIPMTLGIARDDPQDILGKVEDARRREADVLFTSGGASLGEKDILKRVLQEAGLEVDFWRVKMRPGTPFSFGWLRGGALPPLPVFGLPGNPASSFVTFQVFGRPFLLRMAGHERVHRSVILGTAGEDFVSPLHLTQFFRVVFRGDPASPAVFRTGPQTSGLVRPQGLAQGLAVVPEGAGEVKEGDPIRVMLLDDLGIGHSEAGYLGA